MKKYLGHLRKKFGKEGSGWRLDSIQSVDLNICQYKPIRGSNYIETPKAIEAKKAVVNVQNDDNKCFLYSVLAALHPVEHTDHPQRVSHYKKYLDTLKFQGIELPVRIDQVQKF